MNPLSVIIPSRNAANLVPCICAIREAEETCRIIVVWDGDYPLGFQNGFGLGNIDFLFGATPFVFARNINIGIQEAGTDDVILLNDDALLKTPRGLTAMQLAYTQTLAPCGVVSAVSNNVGNPAQQPRPYLPGKEMRDELRTLCFICVFIPHVVIACLNGLDERFVGYGLDDDDYCLRVRNAGLKLGIFDGCYVDHGSLTSSFRGAAGRGGDFTGNMKLFIEKWGFDNWGKSREKSQFAALFPREGE